MRGLLLAWMVGTAATVSAFDLTLGLNGDVTLGANGPVFGLRIYQEGWKGALSGKIRDLSAMANVTGRDVKAMTRFFDMGDSFGKCASGRVTLVQSDANTAVLSADILSRVDQNPELIAMELKLPSGGVQGLPWSSGDGRKGTFPKETGTFSVYRGKTDSFTYADPVTRKPVTLSFAEPMDVYLQDDRQWGPMFSLRISIPNVRRAFMKGEQRSFIVSISHPDGMSVDHGRPVVVERGSEWIPIDYHKDVLEGSALDFSGMGFADAPAGKYGWLKAVDGHFEFEKLPGKAQRFYGVNFCSDANAPDAALATQVVTRIRRLGYNTIRIHHHERALAAGMRDGLTLNPERMDRFDRLCALAIENGLYLTTDLFVSRQVRWREIGVDQEGDVPMQMFKMLVAIHDPAFENWKAFAQTFLLHVNPYTGRKYADEPALPLISYINENTMSWDWNEFRKSEFFKRAWRTWLSGRRAKNPNFARGVSEDIGKAGSPYEDAAVQCFMADIEIESSRRQRDFLRSLGCKALFTGQNCCDNQPMASAREAYDYVDTHFYVDHPQFLGEQWQLPSKCANENPVLSTPLAPVNAAYVRMAGKPFTVTEWNFSGPGMFRGVGGIMTGALAALQDWDGLWRFDYSYNADCMREGRGHPGYFDVASDPLGQASERACICLYLRGDLGSLDDRIALEVGPAGCPQDNRSAANQPDWLDEAWNVQVARTTRGAVKGFRAYPLRDVKRKLPFTPKGCMAIKLDRSHGRFTIDTPCTSGGFTPTGAIDAGALQCDVGDVAATVWASSLDGRPLAESGRILITHLTDVQADGNVYADKEKRILLRWGGKGTVVRAGRATISLAVGSATGCEVWGLETSGRRSERMPAEIAGGRMTFVADIAAKGGARMLYEVVVTHVR